MKIHPVANTLRNVHEIIWASVGWAKRSVPIRHLMGTKKPLPILHKANIIYFVSCTFLSWSKGVLTILSTFSLAIALTACGQKGQLYPASAEEPAAAAVLEPIADNDITSIEPRQP